jgi:glutamyl-Q tRNA(Asp) synthetase
MPEHAASHSPPKPLKMRGRFAPSPTGALHFGSLVAALASYLDARNRGAEWFVRIEDLDPPREVSGAADEILRSLEVYALHWDGPILYQSRRYDRYAGALERLQQAGLAYPCACTRSEVADSALHGIEGPVYPGTCRAGLALGRQPRAWRVRTPGESIEFIDEHQGRQEQDLEREIGDFVLQRADRLYAYQLAVVVDDAEQSITRIVRGADLLNSTPRQIYLQRLLGFPTPAYLHVPVVVNAAGEKLSKQTRAAPIAVGAERATLFRALHFLGQRPPVDLAQVQPEVMLRWAVEHWDPRLVPRVRAARET